MVEDVKTTDMKTADIITDVDEELLGNYQPINREIIVTLDIEGIHHWPEVEDTKYAAKMGFLAYPHRHIFKIKAYKKVQEADREIEIIDFKHKIDHYIKNIRWPQRQGGAVDFGTCSCEMIAEDLARRFGLSRIEVLEDGENGGGVIINGDFITVI